MPDLHVNAVLVSDVGLKRELNEDSGIAKFPVFAVADGMGGHDSGEIASAIIIEQLRTLATQDGALTTPEQVTQALAVAHQRVAELSQSRPHGAGSTVSGVAAVEIDARPHWLVFNVGDSRVYRLRDGALVQWTRDHSLVQQWVDSGIMTPEQAAQTDRGNEITRAMGAEDSAPDFFVTPIVNAERLLICSDGLHGLVSAEALRASLVMGGTPGTTAGGLIERALNAGGRDNVTAIVLDVVSGGATNEVEAVSESIGSAGAIVAHAADRGRTEFVPRSQRRFELTDSDTVSISSLKHADDAHDTILVSESAALRADDTVLVDEHDTVLVRSRQDDVDAAEIDEATVLVRRAGSATDDRAAAQIDDDIDAETVLVRRVSDVLDADTVPVR
jgi:protein phosphatase